MKERLFILSQYLLPHHLLSRLAGCIAECRVRWFKNAFTQWFAKRYQVDMSQALVEDLTAYEHFNAFFTRALKDGARPLDQTRARSSARPTVRSASSARSNTVACSRPRATASACWSCSAVMRRMPHRSWAATSPPFTCRRRITTACTCRWPAPCAKWSTSRAGFSRSTRPPRKTCRNCSPATNVWRAFRHRARADGCGAGGRDDRRFD